MGLQACVAPGLTRQGSECCPGSQVSLLPSSWWVCALVPAVLLAMPMLHTMPTVPSVPICARAHICLLGPTHARLHFCSTAHDAALLTLTAALAVLCPTRWYA